VPPDFAFSVWIALKNRAETTKERKSFSCNRLIFYVNICSKDLQPEFQMFFKKFSLSSDTGCNIWIVSRGSATNFSYAKSSFCYSGGTTTFRKNGKPELVLIFIRFLVNVSGAPIHNLKHMACLDSLVKPLLIFDKS